MNKTNNGNSEYTNANTTTNSIDFITDDIYLYDVLKKKLEALTCIDRDRKEHAGEACLTLL